MPGAVRRQHILDLVHDHALAGRSALVGAEVAIGVEPALPVKHPDLDIPMRNDTALTVRQFRQLRHEHFRHPNLPACSARNATPKAGFGEGGISTWYGPDLLGTGPLSGLKA